MEELKTSNSHILIPEKEPTFSSKENVYFDEYISQFTTILDATVPEIKEWEDETVLITLNNKKEYLSKLDVNKLLAYKNFDAKQCKISTPLEFSNIATIINDEIPLTDSLDPIDPAYVAWAIEVLEKHDSNNEIELHEEVAVYVAICFHEEGFLHMPEDLSIFNDYLYEVNTDEPVQQEANDKIKRIDDYLAAKRKGLSS